MSSPARIRASIVVAVALLAVGLLAVGLLPTPPPAAASGNQLAMFEEDVGLFSHPVATLATLRTLGAGVVRVPLRWSEIAPNPSSPTAPSGFNGADPASYPAGSWDRFDRIVTDAQQDGIQVLFILSGPAPRWATGPGQPASGPYLQWRPSASGYGQFAQAVTSRYSGHYRPCSSCSALPRVHSWEIWNEPNWGEDLSPQANPGSTVLLSPAIYRGLLNAAWTALQRSGHGRDTILVGSLSPRGWARPGYLLATKPLLFLRALYCVDGSYHQLRGGAAAAVGCPTTSAASKAFRSQNAALFGASGFGVHPYPFNQPPTQADSSDPNYVEFSEIPRLASALDSLQRVYGSRKQLQIFNTEYGYETNPPNRSRHFVSPATAGYYINWAEYLSWRNPRIASTMQYLLNDPPPAQGQSIFGFGGFAAGLVFFNGKAKDDYYAYRLPVFLPVTSTARGASLEVWGCVRPANYAKADTHGGRQRVQIQFRQGAHGSFRTLKTVLLTNALGYFDLRMKFPASGSVRLFWSYPRGPSPRGIYSRVVGVRIR